MVDFFIRAETALFRYRITCMREDEFLQTVKHIEWIHKLMMKQGDSFASRTLQGVHETLKALSKERTLDAIVKEYFQGSNYQLAVPFLSVINLVKGRKVQLHKGYALVPVTSLLEVLVPIFESTLLHGMRIAEEKFEAVKKDVRIRHLCLQLKVSVTC